jgi:hypothetical protein
MNGVTALLSFDHIPHFIYPGDHLPRTTRPEQLAKQICRNHPSTLEPSFHTGSPPPQITSTLDQKAATFTTFIHHIHHIHHIHSPHSPTLITFITFNLAQPNFPPTFAVQI